jgi:sialidase-1
MAPRFVADTAAFSNCDGGENGLRRRLSLWRWLDLGFLILRRSGCFSQCRERKEMRFPDRAAANPDQSRHRNTSPRLQMIPTLRSWFVALGAMALTTIFGNGDEVRRTELFQRGDDGYFCYRIPAIVLSRQKTLLAFCEGRKTSTADHGDIDLVLRRSFDEGQTWGPLQLVHEEGGTEPITIGNPSPVVDRTSGGIWLAFTRDNDRIFVTKSADDGATWASPAEITASVKKPEWSWFATGPGHALQLANGRLVIPCDTKVRGTKTKLSLVIYSDDHGETWNLGGVVGDEMNECQITDLDDGSLLLSMRNYLGQSRRAFSMSHDAGLSWSPPSLHEQVFCPTCEASILRYPSAETGGKSRLLYSGPGALKRQDLTIRLSDDGGQTWPVSRVLQTGNAEYSDLVLLPDGTIGCLYERNGYRTMNFDCFTLGWLTAGTESVRPTTEKRKEASSKKTPELRPMRHGTELFVDDVKVARKENVVRRIHAATKLDRPVLVGDQPWEKGGGSRLYGTVHYDPTAGEFRMWYSRQYATSRDGLHWTKPVLDVVEQKGRWTNFVLPKSGGAVVVDDLEPDPAKRYKALGAEPIAVGGFSAYYSADGLHWTRYGEDRVLKVGSELGHVIRDPATRKYFAYIRPYGPKYFPKNMNQKRLGAVTTSDDFVHWSEMKVVLTPDAIDDAWVTEPNQRTEFYAMNGFAYGRSYLGIIPIFRVTQIRETVGPGESKYDGPMEGQLITSRDGLTWQRMAEREPVLPGGADFDRSIMNVAVSPIVVGDEIWEYYTGLSTTHGGTIPPKRACVALAKWRLDGFVSLDAGVTEGRIETMPIPPSGPAFLEVNAKADAGAMTVEVLDEAGKMLPGYATSDCTVLTMDGVRQRVQWKDRLLLPGDVSVRLRFIMRNTSLFSYTLQLP